MRTLKIKKLSLAVCLALMPLSVYAAGLGKLSVTSNLGEPFKAEIALLATTPEELESLVAVIASEEAYAAQGITRLGIHSDIKVEIINAKSGSPKLKLSSNQAVTDPYVDMLIQLDWASGRLQREYTVLLDPPGYKQSIQNEETAAVTSPTAKSPKVQPAQSVAESKPSDASDIPAEGVDAPEVDDEIKQLQNKSKPVYAKPAVPTQRKTQSGDNLSKIASAMRVEGVSLDQMLVALYAQNKDAFVGENMNRLKVGKVIKLPSKDNLLGTSKAEASKTVQLHVRDWNAYRTGVASATPEAKNSVPTPSSQSDSGKIATAEPALPSQNKLQDVVKLSAGDKDKSLKDAKKAEEAKKLAEQEDKVAHDKSLADAQNRTTAVEKQIEDMQKLLVLKNKAMTDLQKKAEADLAQQKTAAESKASETKPAETPAIVMETPKSENENVAPVEEVKPEATKEEVKPAAAPKPPVIEKPVVEQPVVPEVETPSFFDGLLETVNLPLLAGIAGVGLLGAGWMFLRNKRRKDLESFERGILTSGGLRANTVFGNTTGNTSSTDTSFLTDFAQSTDGSMMDTNEVDPIAEAEVYMAYGRDAQAEEILKDAILKEPKRYELHLKLLEMYAARKDTSAFEAIAGELYTILGSDDATWAKIAEMGRGLEPENPLYIAEKTAKVDGIPLATEKVVPATVLPIAALVKSTETIVNPIVNVSSDVATTSTLSAPNLAGSVVIESIVKRDQVQPTVLEQPKLYPNAIDSDADALYLEENTSQTMLVSEELSFEPIPDDDRIKQSFESAAVEDISFESDDALGADNPYEVTQADMTVADLNFDLNQDETQDDKEESTQAVDSNLKAFDLSAISLDLNEPATALSLDDPEVTSNNAMNADANDVEVKLNLVTAYIDMDDKEGARELLEEILKEGNEEQLVRAQMMLDSMS